MSKYWQLIASLIFLASWSIPAITQEHIAEGYCAKTVNVPEGDYLQLRAAPDVHAQPIEQISASDEFVVFPSNQHAEWARAQIFSSDRHSAGWVNAHYIAKTSSQACTSWHLYQLGISLQPETPSKGDFDAGPLSQPYQAPTPQYPNHCAANDELPQMTVSISDDMLAYFKEKGFTLKTLCLAITAARMRTDPETGVNLPGATVRGIYERVNTNVPACFNKGTPLLDCEAYFGWFWGEGERPSLEEWENTKRGNRRLGEELDVTMRRLISNAQVSETVLHYDDFAKLAGEEQANELFANHNSKEGISFIEVSNEYPRGYAYQLSAGTTAGDSVETDTVNLTSATRAKIENAKLNLAVPWNLRTAKR
jgi:hypothetical protein